MFFVILISLLLIYLLFGNRIRAWFIRRMQRKFEDYFRQATGMPPRDDANNKRNRSRADRFTSANRRGEEVDMAAEMRKVAVDVEFTEVHDYSEKLKFKSRGDETRVRVEQQVSDAEFVVIKNRSANS